MSLTSDEQAVRDTLGQIGAADQPPAPNGRVDSVRRRHLRRRHAQASGSLAAVAVLTVGTVAGAHLVGSSAASTAASTRAVPSWALTWPDQRDPSIPPSILDSAVRAWSHDSEDNERNSSDAAQSAPRQTIWYVAQPVGNTSDVAVVFEVDGVNGHRLVTGVASRDAAARYAHAGGQDDPWLLHDIAAPPRTTDGVPPVVSFYDPVTTVRAATIVSPGPADNWVVVLTSPQATSWRLNDKAQPPLSRGLGVANAGPLRAPATVSVPLPTGATVADVGLPGNAQSAVPALAAPAAPVLGHDFGFISGVSAQGNQTDGMGDARMKGKRLHFAVTCYGSPSLVLRVNGVRLPAVSCDEQTHVLSYPRPASSSSRLLVTPRATADTSYTIDVGIVH
jgi:hypothetical protein